MEEQPTTSYTRGEIMPEEVESRIEKARRILETLNYHLKCLSPKPREKHVYRYHTRYGLSTYRYRGHLTIFRMRRKTNEKIFPKQYQPASSFGLGITGPPNPGLPKIENNIARPLPNRVACKKRHRVSEFNTYTVSKTQSKDTEVS